ncbi:hypothetical protein ACGF0J_21135 [Nonomuraea sp. NPDC047897]
MDTPPFTRTESGRAMIFSGGIMVVSVISITTVMPRNFSRART